MAIELLDYGQTHEISPILSAPEAFDAIMPLRQLLRDEGIAIVSFFGKSENLLGVIPTAGDAAA